MPVADLEICSGGQTGVDRAALDVAMTLGLPCSGWVPLGRLAEDGVIPERYPGLRETVSPRPDVRTRRNVRDSDATLIVAFGALTGGTALTLRAAKTHRRPVLVVDLRAEAVDQAAADVRRWIASLPRPLRLNVAGPRESSAPGAYAEARRLLLQALT